MKKTLMIWGILFLMNSGYTKAFTVSAGPEINAKVSVYPNPASDVLNIEFDGPVQENTTLRLINLFGEEVMKEHISENTFLLRKQLDLSELSKGIYYLKIKVQDKEITKRIVLQ